MFSEIEESYPGYSEDIKMTEFEDIKTVINEKYKTDFTSTEIRSECEEAFNKIFNKMLAIYPNRIFDIIYILMDEFNISESKAVRCLNKENREIVRNFAISTYHTGYYQKKERELEKEKMERLGKPHYEFRSMSKFFK
jgi:hypothetical protein